MALERLLIDLDDSNGCDDERMLHLARYRFAASFVKDQTVLDIACGAGYGSCIMARAGAKKVVGADIAEEAIRYARDRFRESNLEYRVASATELEGFGENFDRVVSFETIEHLETPRHLLEGAVQLLKRDGMLVISTPNRVAGTLEDKPGNPFHLIEWSQDEFRGLLSGFFREVRMYGQWFYLPAGRLPGSRTMRRALMDLVAPGLARAFQRHDITGYPDRLPWLKLVPEYVVALCSGPIR